MMVLRIYSSYFVRFEEFFVHFVVKKESYTILKIIFFLTAFLLSSPAFTQETKISETIVSIAEDLAADESDPEAISLYIDQLRELADNPVKINSSGEEEISRLFFLSDFQVKVLADYIRSSGKIISVFEIANIPGFDKETAKTMIPFISLDIKSVSYSAPLRWRNTLITNISDKPGPKDPSSLGSSVRILTKYMFTSGSFSGGFSAEKDPGEKLISGNPPVPDFISAHLAYKGTGLIKRIIIGDFSARFGQGTNVNTGIRTGLTLTAPGFMAARNEIRPYTSTDENSFFRGVAGDFGFKNLGVSLFYSVNSLDATIESLSGNSGNYVKSFYQSGLHNSSSSMVKKDAISDLSYGINVSYNFNNLRIGAAFSEDRLSLPVKPQGNNPLEVFDFKGDCNSIYTLYYNTLIKKIILYGDISVNQSFKHAIVQGISLRPSDRLNINFLYRNYDTGFSGFHGKGPGSRSANGNEQGTLGNFNFEAAKHLFLSGGVDIQYFPWLKYRCSAPSMGIRKELRAMFLPTEKLSVEALYNYRLTMTDGTVTIGIPVLKEIVTRGIKGSVKYSLYDYLTIGTRIDYKVVNPSGSKGVLLSQDIVCRFSRIPVTLWMRYCLYKTDDWDSRIYVYENDLLYSFSIPALSGEGSRSYIMVKWDISDSAEIRLKYGLTSNLISRSEYEENDELKFQIKILF